MGFSYTVTGQNEDEQRPELVSAMTVAMWRRDAERYAQVKAVWEVLEAATTLGQMMAVLNTLYDLLHKRGADDVLR